MTRSASIRDRIALALLGLVLAVRVLVPAGWMPAEGRGFALTVCTGTAMETVWVDIDGKTHKQAPAKGGDQHCAFAGLGAPLVGGDAPALVGPAGRADAPGTVAVLASVGQGLAAPPPPATGPPATV